MFWFALRKYLTYSVVIIILMAVGVVVIGAMEDAPGNLSESLSRAVVWGGLFGLFYTHIRFSSKKIWPLFDNLQIHRYAPMAAGYAFLLALLAVLRWAL